MKRYGHGHFQHSFVLFSFLAASVRVVTGPHFEARTPPKPNIYF